MNYLKFSEGRFFQMNRNFIILYGAMGLSLVLGVFLNIFLSNYLNPEDFGKMSFIRVLFGFLQIIFSFGLFHSISRGIALNDSNTARKKTFWSANIRVSIVLGLIVFITLFIYSFFHDHIFHNEMNHLIRIISPLGLLIPARSMVEISFEGEKNKILLSLSRILPKFLIVTGTVIITKVFTINIVSIYLIEAISIVLTLILLFKLMKISPFENNLITKKHIILNWKNSGLKIYYSILFGSISMYMLNFTISYYLDGESYGLFMFATNISTPLNMIPLVFSSLFFRDFVKKESIDKRSFNSMFFVSVIAFLIFLIFIFLFFDEFFNLKYHSSQSLIYLLGGQCLLHGIADFYNKILVAKGKGNQVLRISYMLFITNTLSIFLVPYFSTRGAIFAKYFVTLTYLLFSVLAVNKLSQNK